MKIMSVDFGDARTGLAICNSMQTLASPAGVIMEYNFDKCVSKVAEKSKELEAQEIVVGFPKNMNGTIGPRAEKCKLFAEKLKEQVDVPVLLWDERSTTVAAHNILNVTNTRGKKRKAIVDEVAATLILESYMGYKKTKSSNEV